MRKRRKLIIGLTFPALILIVLIAMCFAPSRRPANEPRYQGRYLSEWLADPKVLFPDLELADPAGMAAVRAIGTNGLPYYLEWLRYEPGESRQSMGGRQIHRWLQNIPVYSNWLNPPAQWRAIFAFRGFEILGTNAASAIPELATILSYTNKPYTSGRALGALYKIGPQSIPVLEAALADTNRADRAAIAGFLGAIAREGNSNACLPILTVALADHDADVRKEARRALDLLTNAPAQ